MAATGDAGDAARRSPLEIIYRTWRLNVKLESFLSTLDATTTYPTERLPKLVNDLHVLYDLMTDVLGLFQENLHPIVNRAIHVMRNHREHLGDVIERFELSLDPSVAEDVTEAIEEYKRGETVSVDSLRR
jgi:hypothetical protein